MISTRPSRIFRHLLSAGLLLTCVGVLPAQEPASSAKTQIWGLNFNGTSTLGDLDMEDAAQKDPSLSFDDGSDQTGKFVTLSFVPADSPTEGDSVNYTFGVYDFANMTGGDASLNPEFVVTAKTTAGDLMVSVEVVDSVGAHYLTRSAKITSDWQEHVISLTDFYGWYGDGADGSPEWPLKAIHIKMDCNKKSPSSDERQSLSIKSLAIVQSGAAK